MDIWEILVKMFPAKDTKKYEDKNHSHTFFSETYLLCRSKKVEYISLFNCEDSSNSTLLFKLWGLPMYCSTILAIFPLQHTLFCHLWSYLVPLVKYRYISFLWGWHRLAIKIGYFCQRVLHCGNSITIYRLIRSCFRKISRDFFTMVL